MDDVDAAAERRRCLHLAGGEDAGTEAAEQNRRGTQSHRMAVSPIAPKDGGRQAGANDGIRPAMSPTPRSIQRTYLVLMLLQTLAASLIWGINTLVPARRRLEQHRGVRRQRVLHGRDGRLRSADGRRRRHARPADVLSARHHHAGGVDAAVSPDVAHLGADMGVGDRVGPARARVHVLLGRRRGLARRRADVHRLSARRRQTRDRLRTRRDRRRRRDARRDGRRRSSSRRRRISACRTCCAPVVLVLTFVVRVRADARHRLHAASRQTAARRSARRVARRDDPRSRQPGRCGG